MTVHEMRNFQKEQQNKDISSIIKSIQSTIVEHPNSTDLIVNDIVSYKQINKLRELGYEVVTYPNYTYISWR